MAVGRTRQHATADIWPGFVDALAALLIIVIFLLMVFTLAQYFLSDILTGRDQELNRLNREIAELTEMLSLERAENTKLEASVSELNLRLGALTAERDGLAGQLAEVLPERDMLTGEVTALTGERDALEKKVAGLEESLRFRGRALGALRGRSQELDAALSAERAVSAQAREQVRLLNLQIAALRQQLARIEAALEASEIKAKEQNVRIVNLSKRLNAALADKVQELAGFRSEFFGRLRKALGNRSDVRVVGDRFVFQSEVLFASGKATLQRGGRVQIDKLAKTLKEIARKIPRDIDWVLRVDGHTDRLPIATPAFPSNWELSTGRAIAVVRRLIESGVPATRLAATGFGEFQPIDRGSTIAAFRRNRRIEFKLTQR